MPNPPSLLQLLTADNCELYYEGTFIEALAFDRLAGNHIYFKRLPTALIPGMTLELRCGDAVLTGILLLDEAQTAFVQIDES